MSEAISSAAICQEEWPIPRETVEKKLREVLPSKAECTREQGNHSMCMYRTQIGTEVVIRAGMSYSNEIFYIFDVMNPPYDEKQAHPFLAMGIRLMSDLAKSLRTSDVEACVRGSLQHDQKINTDTVTLECLNSGGKFGFNLLLSKTVKRTF